MIEDTETIKRIKSFGLNTYEAKIWIALLSRGASTAGELSDMANVPRSRSYDVLESLEKKGFVATKHEKPIKYLAIPPKGVLENIKKRIGENKEGHLLGIKSQSFNNIINLFQELHEKNLYNGDNLVVILKGRNNIYKHMFFLLKEAKKDVLFTLENETSEYSEIIESLKNQSKIIIKTKNADARVCLIDDDNTLIFPIQKGEVHPDYDMCIWIKNQHTTKFLKQLFL